MRYYKLRFRRARSDVAESPWNRGGTRRTLFFSLIINYIRAQSDPLFYEHRRQDLHVL